MKKIVLYLLLFSFNMVNAQNIVLNGSFEEFGFDSLKTSDYFMYNWLRENCYEVYIFNPILNTDPRFFIPKPLPDTIITQDGNTFIGMFLFELSGGIPHIMGTLRTTLIKDSSYIVSFYIKCVPEATDLFIKNISVGFGKTNFCSDYSYTDIPDYRKPVLTFSLNSVNKSNAWVKLSGVFKARGDENYIILGVFKQKCDALLIPIIERYRYVWPKGKKKEMRFYRRLPISTCLFKKSGYPVDRRIHGYAGFYVFDNISVELIKKDTLK